MTQTVKFIFPPSSRPLLIARWLLIAMLVAVLFSPPVTNLFQALLVVTVLSVSELRSRVLRACRQPMVIGALAFYLVISIGVFYSIGSSHDAQSMWGGWRKLLLLPLAMAFFDEPQWKARLVQVLVGVAALCALVSYYGYLTHTLFPVPDANFGTVVRNHSTQGMIFAVAALAAIAMAFQSDVSPTKRWLLGAAALLLASNTVFVTAGRSGYLVLVVCTVVLVAGWAFIGRSKVTLRSISISLGALGLIVAVLAISSVSRKGITQAVDEMQNYRQAETVTSMGIRIFFWKNTVLMIKERPVFGYGTGAFGEAYRRQINGQEGVGATLSSDPHNQFMKIAAEHGLAGLVVFLAFLAAALAQRPSAPYRLLGLGVLAAWCATSMANSHFSTYAEGVFLYLWVGAMLANERNTSD